ncbi:hypothetical protein [Bacillus wiedmannii]|uniref:hypothetical protein n=1 Tax=Bacillus wiedmannii TaxID=1890302 RepID=UPI003D98D453
MKGIIEYIIYGIFLLIATIYQINESFPGFLPFHNPSESSIYFLFLFLGILVIGWFFNKNRPGTYEKEKNRWIVGSVSYMYFMFLLFALPALSKNPSDDAIFHNFFAWGFWFVLIVIHIREWGRLQNRRNNQSTSFIKK